MTIDRAERRAPYGASPEVGAVGQRTRERLLEAAKEALADVSFHDLRVEDIADRAGCSRTSLYQYFSSKEHILLVLSTRVTRDLEAVTPILDGLGPTRAGRNALTAWIREIGAVYARHASVFGAWTPITPADEVKGRAMSVMAVYHRDLGQRLERAGARLPDAEIAAQLLFATVLRCWHRAFRRETDVAADTLATSMADVLHRSLFATKVGR